MSRKIALLLCVVFLLVVCDCTAQQELFSRQYFMNNYLANPALAGVNDYMDLRLSYSRQWTEIEHSPSSVLLTFNTNLAKQKDEVMRYAYRDRKYRIARNGLSDQPRRIKHGVGARVIYDKINVFTNTTAALSYACHVPLSAYWTFSAGVSAGGVLSSLDLNGGYLDDPDDPLLNVKKRNEMIPMVDAGIWLYSTALYFGASVSQLMSNPYDGDDKANYMNVYLTAGWQYSIKETFTFVPSVMYRMNGYSDAMVDVNARFIFNDLVWVGASLRNLENYSFHLGFSYGDLIEMHYTCDVNKKVLGLSHEIGIGYKIWTKARECKNRWYFK